MLNKLAALVILAGFLTSISACNTMAGVGQDVKATGQAIENAADKRKRY